MGLNKSAAVSYSIQEPIHKTLTLRELEILVSSYVQLNYYKGNRLEKPAHFLEETF